MSSILLFIFAFAINENYGLGDELHNPQSRAHTIVQQLDHFDISNNKTWNMRYFSNQQYCNGTDDSPLFIIFGGPWAITPDRLVFGHFHDIAKRQNACLFHTEHRFYGRSLPTRFRFDCFGPQLKQQKNSHFNMQKFLNCIHDISSDLSVSNLKYLTVQQALADNEHFVDFLKNQKHFNNSKVILYGISYGGSMVAWFGNKYRSLVDGAWISSAPLLARMDFTDYGEIIGKIIRQFGSIDCYNRIRMGIIDLENLLNSSETMEIRELLHISEDFNDRNQLDIWLLFEEISLIFANFLQGHEKDDVTMMCNLIMKSTSNISAVVNFILKRLRNPNILEISYQKMIRQMSNVHDFSGGLRQWYYQSCSGVGWYPTTTSSDQPFGTKIPIDLYIRVCSDLFGSEYSYSYIERKINETNFYLNGDEICKQTKNKKIFMTYGQMDPWSSLGCPSDGNDRVRFISNVSHSKDFESISDSDSADMRDAKQKVEKLISEWL